MGTTIGDVAKLAKVSVRTLHHYDDIGLLVPSGRSPSGYRLYAASDLERLQRILFYRELGVPLEDIAKLLDDPRADREALLVRQRELIVEKLERLQAMLRLVDTTLDHQLRGKAMNPNEIFEGFDPGQYAEEAEQRWGDTDAWRESKRRTARYGKDEWVAIQAEARGLEAELATLMRQGVAADDARAMDVAERHRQHIERWFYPCDKVMHRGLGEMYVADERFTRHYDDQAPGLAAYVHDAIIANAQR